MTNFRTRGPAIEPATRRRKHRRAVRVLLTASDHLLLFQDTDPGQPGTSWWTTPGGGVDKGETDLDAAVREVHEETGRLFARHDVTGPIATRLVWHGYSDQITSQAETFFAIDCAEPFAVSTVGHTPAEQETLVGYRWWPFTELAAPTELIWPVDVLTLVRLVHEPTQWPLDLGEVEESTVPIS